MKSETRFQSFRLGGSNAHLIKKCFLLKFYQNTCPQKTNHCLSINSLKLKNEVRIPEIQSRRTP
jgi:hypothetical protein